MRRWSILAVAAIALAGCREQAVETPVPAPTAPSRPAEPPRPRGLQELCVALADQLRALAAAPAGTASTEEARKLYEALTLAVPGGELRARLRAARAALGEPLTEPSAEALATARQVTEEARNAVAGAAVYGIDDGAVEPVLSAAESALADRRWTVLRCELERAAALFEISSLEAPLRELRVGLEAADANGYQAALAAINTLARSAHFVQARAAVGRAQQRAEASAFGDAAGELDTARKELLAWAGGETQADPAVRPLLADLDGVVADLAAGAPGVRERLAALWKKLGREPLPTPPPAPESTGAAPPVTPSESLAEPAVAPPAPAAPAPAAPTPQAGE